MIIGKKISQPLVLLLCLGIQCFCMENVQEKRIELRHKKAIAKINEFLPTDNTYLLTYAQKNREETQIDIQQHLADLEKIIRDAGQGLIEKWGERFNKFKDRVNKLVAMKNQQQPDTPGEDFYRDIDTGDRLALTLLYVLAGLKPLYVVSCVSGRESPDAVYKKRLDFNNKTYNEHVSLVTQLSLNQSDFQIINETTKPSKALNFPYYPEAIRIVWCYDPVFPFKFIIESYEQFFKDNKSKDPIFKDFTQDLRQIEISDDLRRKLYAFDDTEISLRKTTDLAQISIEQWDKYIIDANKDQDFTACVLGFQLVSYRHWKTISRYQDLREKFLKNDLESYSKNFRLCVRPPSVVYCAIATTYDLLYSLLTEYLFCAIGGVTLYKKVVEEAHPPINITLKKLSRPPYNIPITQQRIIYRSQEDVRQKQSI